MRQEAFCVFRESVIVLCTTGTREASTCSLVNLIMLTISYNPIKILLKSSVLEGAPHGVQNTALDVHHRHTVNAIIPTPAILEVWFIPPFTTKFVHEPCTINDQLGPRERP
jgi:hypothetical protein